MHCVCQAYMQLRPCALGVERGLVWSACAVTRRMIITALGIPRLGGVTSGSGVECGAGHDGVCQWCFGTAFNGALACCSDADQQQQQQQLAAVTGCNGFGVCPVGVCSLKAAGTLSCSSVGAVLGGRHCGNVLGWCRARARAWLGYRWCVQGPLKRLHYPFSTFVTLPINIAWGPCGLLFIR